MVGETMDESESDTMEPLDRLSELPDSLILIILSFLPMRDIVSTTFLSKRWRDVWTTVEYLDFWDEYCTFITGALAKWEGGKILEFCISFSDNRDDYSETLDSCLAFAVENQVKELNMCLRLGVDPKYRLPQLLYSCSSITKLSIFHCRKLKIMEDVQWDQLKSLTIERADFLSGDAVSKILSGAPTMEELTLWSLEFSEEFYIESSSLKKVSIGYESSYAVEVDLGIWAPNLLTLYISGFLCCSCLLDVPSLINASLCFKECGDGIVYERFPPLEMFDQVFRSIDHVEKVALSYWCVKSLVCMKKKEMDVPFSNAKFLKLNPAEAKEILDVLEVFPYLKMLTIDQDCRNTSDKVSHVAKKRKAALSNPSLLRLKTVEISWSLHDYSIIPALEILLQNAHILEKLVFRPIFFGDHRELLLKVENKVLSMCRSSTNAEVIIIKDFD